ncbi:MAG: hypothetical protein MUC40_02390 [Akkermansiaceae bacterium]|nr:hypothetical protein [Akkermansiaceae bacterium]
MKLLLGATIALLLGALAVSWQGMRDGVKNAPADEVARLRKQITELRMEQDKLQLEKQIQQLKASADYGGFITFQILMPEQVQPGTILAIRRKTGILGQLKVSDVTAEGGIANPLPGFGPVNPQVGDELILPPQY